MGGDYVLGRWFDNLKIRGKLLVGFAAVLAILIALSIAAVGNILSIRDGFDAYSQRVEVVTIAMQLDRDVLDLRRHAREYGLTGQAEDAIEARRIAKSVERGIAAALDETKDPARRQRVQELARRFEKYMINFERIYKQGEEQHRLIREVLDPAGEQFRRTVVKLGDIAAKTGNMSLAGFALSALEHGQLARLYVNLMLGRRDVAFAAKAEAEFQAVTALLNGYDGGGGNRDDTQHALIAELRTLLTSYRSAFDQVSDLNHSNTVLVENVNNTIATQFAEDTIYIRDSGDEDMHRIEQDMRGRMVWSGNLIGFLALAGVGMGILFTWRIGVAIARPVVGMTGAMADLASGNREVAIPGLGRHDEIGRMAQAMQTFKEAAQKLAAQNWVKSNIAGLSTAVQATETPDDFARAAIATLVPLLGGGAGVVYLWNDDTQVLELKGSWGFKKRRHLSTSFRLAEGIVGEAAFERTTILLTEVPDDFVRIVSGTGEATPRCILAAPILTRDRVLGVVEIASFLPFSAVQQALVEEALPVIALNLEIQDRNHRTRQLLERTQRQAEELRTSEEELKAQSDQLHVVNDELRAKSQSLENQAEELRASEEELKIQREELQAANEELSQKTQALEEQATRLENARAEADKRALERDTASRYKSEFLANMSHELRTPLNSLLILARSLAENDDGNLTEDQVDSAQIISESGHHLLRLINDILDLSKVEAGKMVITAADLTLGDFAQSLLRRFNRLAETRHLTLSVTVEDALPKTIRTDIGKLDQILNNLIGNAIKFTESGRVSVALRAAGRDMLAIAVIDTGIGIPADTLDRIFVAFEQVDGSTSRSFGGTGLGLTISRKLAQFLGGDIAVESTLGQGSTFTLTLPLYLGHGERPHHDHAGGSSTSGVLAVVTPGPSPVTAAVLPVAVAVPRAVALRCDDDRDTLTPKDEIILIIEDDIAFARIVRDTTRKQGFKCLVAQDGPTGLDLARRFRPTGIILDVGLPGLDGWGVMDSLKKQPETRHIPVHFMSATEASRKGLEMGAVGFFTKPVTREQIIQAFARIHHFAAPGTRRLLLVEDDAGTRKAVTTLLAAEKLEIVEVSTGAEAIAHLREHGPFDCMILDLGLPDMDGHALLRRCCDESLSVPPVVIYSGRELSEADTIALREYTDSMVIKGARSPDRLLDEVTLFLHSVQARLPDAEQRILRSLQKGNGADGPVILVVDDDMRNTFSLSKVLRQKGFRVLMAQDGRTALDQLAEAAVVHAVLMDIMMPGMDGYATTREIRKQERFRNLPVIALTAKAMVGDREKCLEAGADDYVSKPVDIDLLLAALHRLLHGS